MSFPHDIVTRIAQCEVGTSELVGDFLDVGFFAFDVHFYLCSGLLKTPPLLFPHSSLPWYPTSNWELGLLVPPAAMPSCYPRSDRLPRISKLFNASDPLGMLSRYVQFQSMDPSQLTPEVQASVLHDELRQRTFAPVGSQVPTGRTSWPIQNFRNNLGIRRVVTRKWREVVVGHDLDELSRARTGSPEMYCMLGHVLMILRTFRWMLHILSKIQDIDNIILLKFKAVSFLLRMFSFVIRGWYHFRFFLKSANPVQKLRYNKKQPHARQSAV